MNEPRKGSKREKAIAIYRKWAGTKARKEVLEKLVGQAGLTEKGAATYYQSFKSDGVKVEKAAASPPRKRPAVKRPAKEAVEESASSS